MMPGVDDKKKTMESTEQAWNKNVKFQELLEKTGRVVCNMRLPERKKKVECLRGRTSW